MNDTNLLPCRYFMTVSFNLTYTFSYAKFLSKQGKPKEAFQRLKVSQEIFIKVRGKYEREYVDIINDLAVLSLQVRLTH